METTAMEEGRTSGDLPSDLEWRRLALVIIWAAPDLRAKEASELIGCLLLLPYAADPAKDKQKPQIFGASRVGAAVQLGEARIELVRMRPGEDKRYIPLEDNWTSRRQLKLENERSGVLRITNLSTTRPVLVNGRGLTVNEYLFIQVGDLVEIQGRLLFELKESPSSLVKEKSPPPLARQAKSDQPGALSWDSPVERLAKERLVPGISSAWRELHRATAKVSHGPIVFIHGPSGSGKTGLALELHAHRAPGSVELTVLAAAEVSDDSLMAAALTPGTVLIEDLEQLPTAAQTTFRQVLVQGRSTSGSRAPAPHWLLTSCNPQPLLRTRGELLPELVKTVGDNTLRIPSLDERREDILLLAEYFLYLALPNEQYRLPTLMGEANRAGKLAAIPSPAHASAPALRPPSAVDVLTPEAQQALFRFTFEDEVLQLKQLLLNLANTGPTVKRPVPLQTLEKLMGAPPTKRPGLSPPTPSPVASVTDVLGADTPERQTFEALISVGYNISSLKQALDICRAQVYRRLNTLQEKVLEKVEGDGEAALSWCLTYCKRIEDSGKFKKLFSAATD